MPHLHWTPLPGRHGGAPAVSGRRMAAASRALLSVWHDGQAATMARSPVAAAGAVCWLEQGLCWGPGRADGEGAVWQPVPALLALAPPPLWMPLQWAWRSDGRELLLTAAAAPPARGGTRALRASAAGELLAQWPVLDGAEAPTLLSAELALIGHRQAALHAPDGQLLARLSNATPALRLAFCGGTAHALLVEAGRIGIHDLRAPTLAATWSGNWIDAAATPDGRWLLAVDVHGALAQLDAREPAAPPTWWPTPDPVQSVATDGITVLASFRSGPIVRRADWPD